MLIMIWEIVDFGLELKGLIILHSSPHFPLSFLLSFASLFFLVHWRRIVGGEELLEKGFG